MPHPNEDPLLRSARREMLVTFAIVIAAMAYTLIYCYLHGYNRQDVQLVLGVPDWVMWGIFLPWGVTIVICLWFSFWFMEDVPLGQDQEESPAGEPEDAP